MQIRAGGEPFLRGYGAVQLLIVCLVALGHISTLPYGPDSHEALQAFGYDPSWIGVNVLFILAGFMAMRSLKRPLKSGFMLLSRVKRIFPYLASYALLTVFIIYPALGVPAASLGELFSHLGFYAIDVLACIDPGRALPGLLDDANYQCIIQGAIWTFRWGIAAYVGITIASKLRLLEDRSTVLAIAVVGVCGYTIVHAAQVWGWFAFPESLQPAARLLSMFAVGMAIFSYRAEMFKTRLLVPAVLTATLVQYYVLPWTPLIEIFLSVFWALTAFAVMQSSVLSALPEIKNQGLTIALYIFHWPVAQLILLSCPDLGSWGLIAAALPASLLFSFLLSRILSPHLSGGTTFAAAPQSSKPA